MRWQAAGSPGVLLVLAAFVGLAPACSDDEAPVGPSVPGPTGAVPESLFATDGDNLVAFDVATGAPRTGAIANVKGPTDLQALDSGHVLVNLTDNGEVLAVDARTFREVARIKSSSIGATRPVHSFVTPKIGGKQFWAANNDGDGTAATNSLVFIDIVPESATFLKAVGEIPLGIGHHKDAWSQGKARVSVSNIADCDTVMQVIDYADPTRPVLVKKWSAAELDPARTCGPGMGVSPHGAAAAANGLVTTQAVPPMGSTDAAYSDQHGIRLGHNQTAFRGGFRLWTLEDLPVLTADLHAQPPQKPRWRML